MELRQRIQQQEEITVQFVEEAERRNQQMEMLLEHEAQKRFQLERENEAAKYEKQIAEGEYHRLVEYYEEKKRIH